MSSVWVIEQGCYSDYHVVGVYDSKEKAEVVCAALMTADSYDKPTVAEWPLNPSYEDAVAGVLRWHVVMDFDGNAVRTPVGEFEVGPHEDYSNGNPKTRLFWTQLTAPDVDTAIKIANERRIMFLASL